MTNKQKELIARLFQLMTDGDDPRLFYVWVREDGLEVLTQPWPPTVMITWERAAKMLGPAPEELLESMTKRKGPGSVKAPNANEKRRMG